MNKLPLLVKGRTFSPVYRYLSLLSRKTSFYHEQTYKPQNSLLPVTHSSLTSLTYLCKRHESIVAKWKEGLKNMYSDTTKVRIAGCLVYEKIVDEVDYKSFFEAFQLPDTFQSWFVVIQMHVWIMTVVTISERHGRKFRNSLVDSMWNDIEMRLDQIEKMRSSLKRKYLKELVSQFQAAIVAYDEGILSDDEVLAAAVWRTVFACQLVDPELLENVVLYIRRQIAHVDSESADKIILSGSVSFLPLQIILSECKE